MHCQAGKCQCVVDAIPQEHFVGEKAKQITCDKGIIILYVDLSMKNALIQLPK